MKSRYLVFSNADAIEFDDLQNQRQTVFSSLLASKKVNISKSVFIVFKCFFVVYGSCILYLI